MNIEQIAKLAAKKRAKGGKVGLAHGTFDLLHLGHIRHLKQARDFCDCLAVTVTADEFVNKGPSRPAFTASARVEMLEALDCVDWVAINHAPDAVPAIEAIKPDYYVKGPDYQNLNADITGKIIAERDAVHRHGGSLISTAGETWSSSHLINEHVPVFDEATEDYLSGLRRSGALDEILALIDSVRDYRVVVLGETIIDEYDYAVPIGMPRKEPIIAARYQNGERFAGGAVIVANVLASFCAEVCLITAVPNDDECAFVRDSLRDNVSLHSVSDRSSIRKRRFIDPLRNRKMFEIYHLDDGPLPDCDDQAVRNWTKTWGNASDLVVVADFGHGLISPGTVRMLTGDMRSHTFVAATAQTNTANFGYNLASKYRYVDYLCVDEGEARLATQMHNADHVDDVAYALSGAGRTIITRGVHGCMTVDLDVGRKILTNIPAVCRNVVDTVGTGDAFLAATAALVKSGGNLEHIGFIGNVAGALKAGILGQRSYLDKPSLIRAVTALLK